MNKENNIPPQINCIPDSDNPYLAARQEWNERYGSYIARARNWRLATLLSLMISLIAVSGLVYVSVTSKWVPYLVRVESQGQVSYGGRIEQAKNFDNRIIKAFLVRFVTDWRSVLLDNQAQSQALERVYAMVANNSPAFEKLNHYYKEESPISLMQNQSTSVEIITALPISNQSWQVQWQETKRNATGAVLSTQRWQATLTFVLQPPQSEALIQMNPLGLYLKDLNWTVEL